MFIINLTYRQPLEAVNQYLGEHGQFLDRHYRAGRFIFSGRKVPRTGGIILAKAASREELEGILKEDPFHQQGLAEYDITEFHITKFDERFACFMDN
ncbi:YciI family protein [Paenibacillus sp. J22TS3]|uniref:YciI family protein n=1 Tax=Paenibacillus sp. J22TS3 TaxID=2807192 RepID=UPI001B17661B|nr:YciI family protein [Paenibacillus sp. J22TS3]GIP21920.1 hypothetical protein J22TS3_21950 [Paenibacillus sp. J22TS3]